MVLVVAVVVIVVVVVVSWHDHLAPTPPSRAHAFDPFNNKQTTMFTHNHKTKLLHEIT